jgi:hypothetical protein
MSGSIETVRISSKHPLTMRRQLGRSTPRRYDSQQSWHRFSRDRRGALIERVGGKPDIRQAHLIDQMSHVEWQALKLEAEAEAAKTGKEQYDRLRLAADFRRQLLLLDRELALTTKRSTAEPAPRPARLAKCLASNEDHRRLDIRRDREQAAVGALVPRHVDVAVVVYFSASVVRSAA